MSNFSKLAGPIQSNIVNTLGWSKLRPLQDMSIDPLMRNANGLLIAPTAGGKTESAAFPLLSRMIDEDWQPASILYLCPLKALLNNLEPRLRQYSEWIGESVGLWHGDVRRNVKNNIIRNPPQILLITPESIEVILTSSTVDPSTVLGNIRAVVIDEVHAFAGDDRGWHLICVIDRLEKLCKRRIQRISLSATIQNPETILSWLTSSSLNKGIIIKPPDGETSKMPNVQIDYVQSLGNAALVISLLHTGKKRLVFCDSRSRCEQLSSMLRGLGITTFVSHSSLSVDERARAEEAFANQSNCVIVATSGLELGLDVGGLDAYIQIDSVTTVASFLQRLGRTGRREGTIRNCLFLATTKIALAKTMSIVNLWESGFVEPVIPPPLPYPIIAQQIMALCLQKGNRSRGSWAEHIPSLLSFSEITEQDITDITNHMCKMRYLDGSDRLLSVGDRAEREFGFKNWMSLFSVFNEAPMYKVLNGRVELGSVHMVTFSGSSKKDFITLSLGGKSYRVVSINHSRKKAYVEPTEGKASSIWMNSGFGMDFDKCQAVKAVQCGKLPSVKLSNRARTSIDEIHNEFDWLSMESTAMVYEHGNGAWWTYGGEIVNSTIANNLGGVCDKISFDSFCIRFSGIGSSDLLNAEIEKLLLENEMSPYIEPDVIKEIKFFNCLPENLKLKYIEARFPCNEAWDLISEMPVSYVYL